MDDLYDNLDNYNEESTIAELQTENNELKSKLAQYAVTLSKLQTDFDKLSSEYKQLELNYSSLLKTAKAEVERKTQIITNLNLEKDKMVLKSFQNKNAGILYKSKDYNNPTLQQNYKKDKYEKTIQDEKLKAFEGRKLSPHSTSDRKEQDEPSARDNKASSHSDLRSKLLNLAHRGQQVDPRIVKNRDVKENIMHPIKESDTFKARASIGNRRKSMPAISMEMEQFSDDDDMTSDASVKNPEQTYTEQKFIEKQKHDDHNLCERPRSRISETSSSLEEKKSGYQEPGPETYKQRSSRYDRYKNDKHTDRHKSSYKYKRQSPDRYQSGSREHHDFYRRSEHDRQRDKGRMGDSPSRDKFHKTPSREPHYERGYPYEHERLLPRSQERYKRKRRIDHSYDELEGKKMRMEPHSRQFEENRNMELDNKRSKMESHSRHLEEDRRIRDEKKPIDKKYKTDPFEIQFSSCESPDYDCREVSNQHVKEIKLTATTKLDDPRVSSKKYIFSKNDDKVILSTAIGRNVDIVPVRKVAWGIKPVIMPEALVKKPLQIEQSEKDICVEPENLANTSLESGEISNHEDTNTQNCLQKINISAPKLDACKDIEKSLKKINSFKIPKISKCLNDEQNTKHFKEITSLVKPVHDKTDSIKTNTSSEMATKYIDTYKQPAKLTKGKKETESHKQNISVTQSKTQLPFLGTSEEIYPTAKEVVEGDLEMSDDNCDDNEQSEDFTKKPVSIALENKTMDKNKGSNINTETQSKIASEKNILEPCKETSKGDSKKPKTKKKSKHKEREASKSEDLSKVLEKPVKNKEKKKAPKSIVMKTKFSDLFDDSSSLICPEDLGLTAVPTPTTRLPDKCVPFFEDALDAADLNAMRPDAIKDAPTASEHSNIENEYGTAPKQNITNTVIPRDSLEKIDDRSVVNDVQTEMTDEIIKSIYQNLEPDVPEDEDNVVKTVIISSGIQPPVLLKDEQELPTSIREPQIKTIQDVGLNALATSTPHKICQPDVVMADKETKLLDSGSITNNDSQIASNEHTTLMDKSDSNTIDSQSKEANVPDVRIFVKRRRKVIKK